jgi:hypothetical protein
MRSGGRAGSGGAQRFEADHEFQSISTLVSAAKRVALLDLGISNPSTLLASNNQAY